MTLDTEVKSLSRVPMFSEVDPARLKLLAFTSERVQFSPGQRFFSQGDAADAAYVILEGRAVVSLEAGDREIKLAELGQNQLVGEMGVLSDAPRTATVTAADPTTALRMDKRVFLELLLQFPQMSIAILREIARRLERTNAQLAARSDS
jgi:CRP-like cAMP-binding protein